MNAKLKSIIQYVFFIAIAFALIYWQYTALNAEQWQEIKNAFLATNWNFLILSIFVGFLSHLVRAMRWRLLLKASGNLTKLSSTTIAVLIGYLANTLIPRAGEIARCTALTKSDNVPFDKSIGTVISERLFDTVSLLFIFILIFFVEYTRLSDYGWNLFYQFFYNENGELNIVKLILLGLFVIIGLSIFVFIIKKSKGTRLGNLIENVLTGVKSILDMKDKGVFIILSVLLWFLYILVVYIAFKAMPISTHLPWNAAIAVTAFGSIAIIFTPGGIGAYPPIVAGILTLYGLDFISGTALGWVAWTMQTVTVLLLGLAALGILPILSKKTN